MRLERLARLFVTASVIGLSIAWLVWSLGGLSLSDSDAYRQAADRLLAGDDLYVQAETQDEAFRYAPWFAAAWIPINSLPTVIGDILWAALLLVASGLAVLPLARRPEHSARLLALLGGTMLIWTTARGNVHPLVMVALIHGLGRSSGPLWVALAASLKAVPILFALVYLARRDWIRFGLTLAITAVLVLPMPFLGWELGTSDPGESLSLFYLVSPIGWGIVAGIAVVAALLAALTRSRWTTLAAGLAALLLLPRLLLYDLTYLLPAGDGRIEGKGERR